MTTWQDIGTAPRDGTRILAFGCDLHGDPLLCVVEWYVHKSGFYEPVEGTELFRYTDQEYELGWQGAGFTPWHPTHWMPLPSPPSKEGE